MSFRLRIDSFLDIVQAKLSKNLYLRYLQTNDMIKGYSFLLMTLCIVLCCTTVHAQTYIGGMYMSDMTLELQYSPYVVQSDLVVRNNATLTIQEGVELFFEPNTGIILDDGNLAAVGTDEQKIRLQGASATWRGIRQVSLTPNSIILDHVDIDGAQHGVNFDAGNSGFSGAYTLTQVTFTNCGTAVTAGSNMNVDVTISNCTFFDNQIGVDCSVNELRNSIFDGTTIGLQNVGHTGTTVSATSFSNSGTAIDNSNCPSCQVILEDCSFSDNALGFTGAMLQATNTQFVDHSYVALEMTFGSLSQVSFARNAIGLRSYGVVSLDNSVVFENATGVEVKGAGFSMTETTICGNTQFAIVNSTSQAVSIPSNCWCTQDQSIVATAIFDQADDPSLGAVVAAPLSTQCQSGATAPGADDLVYPGDLNGDLSVTMRDLLVLGSKYGQSGDARNNPTTLWIGQECIDWSDSTRYGKNLKHVDADGNGVIDDLDLNPIIQNYRRSYVTELRLGEEQNGIGVPMYFDVPTQVQTGDTVFIPVVLGTDIQLAEHVYGVSFSVEYDQHLADLLPNPITIPTSFLAQPQELISSARVNQTDGRLDVGLVRTDQIQKTGFGGFVTLGFVMKEDIVGRMDANRMVEFNLRFSDVHAIEADETPIYISSTSASFIIKQLESATGTTLDNDDVHIGPNPASSTIEIAVPNNLTIESISISQIDGSAILLEQDNVNQSVLQLPITVLSNGIYLVTVRTDQGEMTQRLTVIR